MKPLRIAINGFGRIGRVFTRAIWNNKSLNLTTVNTGSDVDLYAHLMKYDSIYGPWDHEVTYEDNNAVLVDGKQIKFFHLKDNLGNLWADEKVDVVVEATGAHRTREQAEKHLKAGAKHVVITAPAKGEDITMVYGINNELFDPKKHKIISAASCTTTCLAPVVKVLEENFGIKHGTIMTTHAYTNDQHLVDNPHRDKSYRRSRAAAISIVPTSTGAAKAIGKVIPELNGKLDGNALRVPVSVPSILSFVAEVNKSTNVEEVNELFRAAAKKSPKILAASDIGLVSVDYIRSPFGATIDCLSTLVTDGTQVFVQAWYDNEWGYVTQLGNLLEYMAGIIK